ncbi:hypothetical protein [uncultured Parasutterella sp.]|jgi:hypothetical protein|uniref:hypothetical protein n=1 Tax=uncultured Parasutterella sp. TaxID=1263098 RepID=UPI002059475D|nr:hypothetical protein [uncultured Parasutterella sp.]DAJ56229.1 MAG TPA: Tas1 [Caudoviricetes sp.]
MQHKWIRTAAKGENPRDSVLLLATWRREDVKKCVVDIYKYRYQGVMADWEGRNKPYTVCVYAEKIKDTKYFDFHLLREATQFADTILRLNNFT